MSKSQTITSIIAAGMLVLCLGSCGTGYHDLSTANGRRALMDAANNFLTTGSCDEAISVLQPLYESQYVDNEARKIYASAYACKGGMNFPKIYNGLSGVDNIWASIIKANPSADSSDGHLENLFQATQILRETSTVPPGYEAVYRPSDVNLYNVLLWAEIMGTVLSRLGNADPANGTCGQNISGTGAAADNCFLYVGFGNIVDSITGMTSGPLSELNAAKEQICADVEAATPDPNDTCAAILKKDYSDCDGDPLSTDQLVGAAILDTIDGDWGCP